MASAVEIANLGLNALGQPPIISLGDEAKAARVMQLLFEPCRDAVLRMHPWNFAARRQILAQLSPAPVFGYAHRYGLPSDFMRVLRLNEGREPYQIEADGLLTNADLVELRYVARITDPARFDPLFVQCLAAYLAAEAALTITNSQSLELAARNVFAVKLQEARSVDGMDNYQQVLFGDYFLDVFLGGEDEFRPIAPLQIP